jgi:hypothetical protein
MSNQHWLLQWLDSYAVTSPRQADELLNRPHALSILREEVEAIRYHAPMINDQRGHSIVAGSEIDLSGELSCSNWECIKRQVDTLFSSVWHYFDRIIVAGPSAHFIIVYGKAGSQMSALSSHWQVTYASFSMSEI